jgi:O-antigen/teichoic acid export membrane protein
MPVPKNVLINFLGGAWAGLSMVLSTPVLIRELGLEGFGLIGFWQLIIYLSMVADFGLGAACARELARSEGRKADLAERRSLFLLLERPVLLISAVMALLLIMVSGYVAHAWLSFSSIRADELERALWWLGISVAGQFLSGFYANALAGLQRMGSMNALQAMNNGMRFLGGAGVAIITADISTFFAFQAFVALATVALSRLTLARELGPRSAGQAQVGPLRRFMLFSGGMFLTAICGALMSNADRLAVSKLLDGESLGRYSVALTAVGLLQMLVFAFHRSFYPRFSQLHAAGDTVLLKNTYVNACRLLGAVLVPTGIVFIAFTPQLLTIWLGRSDPLTESTSRLLVLAFVLSGLMWLPAAYQQAAGRTKLHTGMMALTLVVGLPLMVVSISRWGLVGATTLMLLHGVVQVSVVQWLMNRDVLRGGMASWYWAVLLRPSLVSGAMTVISWQLWAPGLGLFADAAWIALTYITAVVASFAWMRHATKSACP